MGALTSLGVYIHIPVCSTLCGYCDFYSIKESDLTQNFWDTYYNRLIEEFKFKSGYLQNNYALNSIYFGGGTPSLASASFIEKLIHYIANNLPQTAKKIEISIEANPETISKQYVNDIHSSGINRISMGVQSLNDRLLQILGRISNKDIIVKAMDVLANGPIANWSADLIYGIPGQKEQDILESLKYIIDHQAKHISAYALTMENNVLHDPANGEQGSDKNISESRQYKHQKMIWEYLPANGFFQYEISNFAREGFSCLHNRAVWKYRPYLSLGTSGHSFLNHLRFRTVSNIKKYLSEPIENSVAIEKAMTIPDLFITALRLKSHQGNALFRKYLSYREYRLWQNMLNEFSNKKWIVFNKSGFEITTEGLSFSNSMLEFVYEHMT